MEIESIRVNFNGLKGEIERLQMKLEQREREHIDEIAKLKNDYELVC